MSNPFSFSEYDVPDREGERRDPPGIPYECPKSIERHLPSSHHHRRRRCLPDWPLQWN